MIGNLAETSEKQLLYDLLLRKSIRLVIYKDIGDRESNAKFTEELKTNLKRMQERTKLFPLTLLRNCSFSASITLFPISSLIPGFLLVFFDILR
jgi:hypothetical protein